MFRSESFSTKFKEAPPEVEKKDVLSEREKDLNFARDFYTAAGEKLATKLTKETNIEHTVADALLPIAESNNRLLDEQLDKIDKQEIEDLEQALNIVNHIKGKFSADDESKTDGS